MYYFCYIGSENHTLKGSPGEVAERLLPMVRLAVLQGKNVMVLAGSVDRSPCGPCGEDTPDDEGRPGFCPVCGYVRGAVNAD